MPVTATIAGGSANADRLTKSMNQSKNPEYVFMGNRNIAQKPQYYVRIFNVGDMEHRIERPWCNYVPDKSDPNISLGKLIIIPACEAGAPYSKPFVIPDIVQEPIRIITSGQMFSNGTDGKFLAQDAINPEDPQGNWRTVRKINAGRAGNEGTNLYRWGVFWTLNETPAAEELDAANKQRDSFYNYLIDEAKSLWMAGTEGRRQIGNTHRRAASYYGLEFEWNQLYRAMQDCPGCGNRVPQTAAICPHCPAVFNWDKALSLGLRTVAQAVAAGIIEPQAENMAKKKG